MTTITRRCWQLAALLLVAACDSASVSQKAQQAAAEMQMYLPSAEMRPGGRADFAAAVTGLIDVGVRWEVVETSGGTIDSSGRYRAPAGTGQFHVRAVSQADAGVTGLATVDVTAALEVGITISSPSNTVATDSTLTFTSRVTGTSNTAVSWALQEASGCGRVTPSGVYVPPAAPATCHVVATSYADPSKSATAPVTVTSGCWALRPVDRVRVYPRPGQAAALAGATIQGSNESATNGFTVLGTISAAPAEAQWTEYTFPNSVPYRFVKYYGPAGGYGQIADVEFYSGTTLLTGTGFGTVGSRSGNPFANALDGDPATFFDGPIANDVYVGLDLAAGHLVELPSFTPAPGRYTSGQNVAIASATAGAAIRYTTNGSDPTGGTVYASPVAVGDGTTTLRAVASLACMQHSEVAFGAYMINAGTALSASSIHIGNSLTDSVDGFLLPLAISGGISLDYYRYTVPGAGTYVYESQPANGNGNVANVQTAVRTRSFDHITMQPCSNMPCLPTGYATDPDPGNRSDAVNIGTVWNDAVGVNAGVQMWVYSTWPGPAAFYTCMTGGGWLRDRTIWNPPTPLDWEEGVAHMLEFNEAVRAGLIAAHPTRPVPYILPAGSALVSLKHAVEAGNLPGVAADGFWRLIYQQGLGTDDHLTSEGRYLVALVFYSAMFQRDPAGLSHATTSLTSAQAAVFQTIAWQTVSGYAQSGISR